MPNEAVWQQILKQHGYASGSIESFRRRGVEEICTDFTRVPLNTRVDDAYEGLKEVLTRPDIDPARVVIMGFSNGAVLALSSVSSVVVSQLVPASPKFRAAVAFYPECALFRPNFTAPVLVLIGSADNWTPAPTCEKLAAQIPPRRPPFKVFVLPGAHHSFDIPNLAVQWYGRARNINQSSGYGATVGYSSEATETARHHLIEFLARVLTPTQ